MDDLLSTLDLDQVVITVGVVVSAWFAYRAARHSRQSKRTSNEAAKSVEKVKEIVDTGNEKDLGTTVHDLAEGQEFIIAKLHTNTKELLKLVETVAETNERLNDHLDEHDKVRSLLRRWMG
jgi:hypothetical protein